MGKSTHPITRFQFDDSSKHLLFLFFAAGDLRAQLQIQDSAAAEERVKNRRNQIRQVLKEGTAELRSIQEAAERRLKDLEVHYAKSKYRKELMR